MSDLPQNAVEIIHVVEPDPRCGCCIPACDRVPFFAASVLEDKAPHRETWRLRYLCTAHARAYATKKGIPF